MAPRQGLVRGITGHIRIFKKMLWRNPEGIFYRTWDLFPRQRGNPHCDNDRLPDPGSVRFSALGEIIG